MGPDQHLRGENEQSDDDKGRDRKQYDLSNESLQFILDSMSIELSTDSDSDHYDLIIAKQLLKKKQESQSWPIKMDLSTEINNEEGI